MRKDTSGQRFKSTCKFDKHSNHPIIISIFSNPLIRLTLSHSGKSDLQDRLLTICLAWVSVPGKVLAPLAREFTLYYLKLSVFNVKKKLA